MKVIAGDKNRKFIKNQSGDCIVWGHACPQRRITDLNQSQPNLAPFYVFYDTMWCFFDILKDICLSNKIKEMSAQDIRWEQRFSNYVKAFSKLHEAVDRIKEDYPMDASGNIDSDSFLDDIIKEGLIQRFEYTHELAWNVMKDFLEFSGNTGIYGSRDATREAFAKGLIVNGEVWMDMIKSRNQTSHTYNEEIADDIFGKIIREYIQVFEEFTKKMETLKGGGQNKLI